MSLSLSLSLSLPTQFHPRKPSRSRSPISPSPSKMFLSALPQFPALSFFFQGDRRSHCLIQPATPFVAWVGKAGWLHDCTQHMSIQSGTSFQRGICRSIENLPFREIDHPPMEQRSIEPFDASGRQQICCRQICCRQYVQHIFCFLFLFVFLFFKFGPFLNELLWLNTQNRVSIYLESG